jgi:stage V sporulation protein B
MAGCLVKVFCNYYLTVIPGFGIKGAALGSTLGFLLVFLLNIFWLTRLTDYRPRIGILLRPLLAVTIMIMVIPAIYTIFASLGNLMATGLTITCGAVCYFAVLLVTKEIRVYEMRYFFRR